MRFDGFDWDSGNRDKCRVHGMALPDIEALFAAPVVILPDKENIQGERRFRAIGRTVEGRGVFVVFTLRQPRIGLSLIRPISARYMHRDEMKRYEKDYPDL